MKRGKLFLCAAAAISVAAALVEPRITAISKSPNYDTMKLAAETMLAAERRIRDARILAGAPIDTSVDPNGTGVIGAEFSETTTSIGELEAKRTTTSPDMAALMVQLLSDAGVRRGDSIAVGASGSFPAATIALLSAARAMDLDVALIVSLGASSWGANLPDFNYLDIHKAARPVLGYDILGVSLGGGGDEGGDMSPEGRRRLMAAIDSSGLYSIAERSNKESVAMRLRAYDNYVYGKRYAAFVNIGGAVANIGEGLQSLELKPGINRDISLPPRDAWGVLYEMASRNIPIIHILNIRSLAIERGLAWDPSPLPMIGDGRIYQAYDKSLYRERLAILAIAYFAILAGLSIAYKHPPRDRTSEEH
jgi:hypothetical protein